MIVWSARKSWALDVSLLRYARPFSECDVIFKDALNQSIQDCSRLSFMDRMSGMRREGTPAWMQVVDGVGNRPSSRTPVAAQTCLPQAGAALPPASL